MNQSPETPRVFLPTGGVLVTDEPRIVTTVLGCCVAVTLFHPARGVAAICHAILPGMQGFEARRPRGYFVRNAVSDAIAIYNDLGVPTRSVVVMLFGGGDVLPRSSIESRGCTVGAENVRVAREMLSAGGFIIRTEDVGGKVGRKILFNTRTGDVLLKRIAGSHSSTGGRTI